MKFAIFGNTYQAKKSSHAETLFRILEEHDAEIFLCREFYHFLVSYICCGFFLMKESK